MLELFLAYGLIAACELYLFLMQRSALEVARESGIGQRASRYMLPLWYVSIWPVKGAKWVLLFLIFRAGGWQPALLVGVAPFILSVVAPVPHTRFLPIFRRRVSTDIRTSDGVEAARLMVALLKTDKGSTRSA